MSVCLQVSNDIHITSRSIHHPCSGTASSLVSRHTALQCPIFTTLWHAAVLPAPYTYILLPIPSITISTSSDVVGQPIAHVRVKTISFFTVNITLALRSYAAISAGFAQLISYTCLKDICSDDILLFTVSAACRVPPLDPHTSISFIVSKPAQPCLSFSIAAQIMWLKCPGP